MDRYPYESHFHYDFFFFFGLPPKIFLQNEMPKNIAQRKHVCQPTEDEAMFSPVTVPRERWNNWNHCGNRTAKEKEPRRWKEGEEAE